MALFIYNRDTQHDENRVLTPYLMFNLNSWMWNMFRDSGQFVYLNVIYVRVFKLKLVMTIIYSWRKILDNYSALKFKCKLIFHIINIINILITKVIKDNKTKSNGLTYKEKNLINTYRPLAGLQGQWVVNKISHFDLRVDTKFRKCHSGALLILYQISLSEIWRLYIKCIRSKVSHEYG